MASMEQAVGITATMYRMRRAARTLWGDRFDTEVAQWRAAIQKVAAHRQVSDLKATILIAQEAQKAGQEIAVLGVFASYVEMVEPTPAPPPG